MFREYKSYYLMLWLSRGGLGIVWRLLTGSGRLFKLSSSERDRSVFYRSILGGILG